MKASRFWIEEKDSEESRLPFSTIICSGFVAARPKIAVMAVRIANLIVTLANVEYKTDVILSQLSPEVRRFVKRSRERTRVDC